MTGAEARAIHHQAFVFDGHNDLAGPLLRGESLEDRGGRGHLDVRRMREGGLDGGIFAVFVDPDPRLPDPVERTFDRVRRLRETLEAHPAFRVVLSAADAAGPTPDPTPDSTPSPAPIRAVIGVEGGYAIRDDLGVVDELFAAGMRCLTLTWKESTVWADAAGGGPHRGLSPFGRRLVDHLQKLGVLIDLSHASDATGRGVLERAERPVVASHSGLRRLAPLPRNLPDGLLEAIAGTGGLVGLSFFGGHLDADFHTRCEALRSRSFEDTEQLARVVREEVGAVPMSRLVAHVEHAVRLVGSEHVALGSDFDGMWAPPQGLEDCARLPELSAALAETGLFDGSGLTAFLGANWRRVLTSALP